MKTLFSLLMMTLISFSAQAKISYGSECGLIDSADEFEVHGSSLKLSEKSKLSTRQGLQIKATLEDGANLTDNEALAALIESSEGGDVYYQTGKFESKSYEVVRYYPGGNPYGAIFKQGSTKPLAFIQDSDIVCANSK